MNPRTVIVVVLALVFGLMAAVLVSMNAQKNPSPEVEKVTVVCAKEDIPAQSEIKQTMLEEREFPKNMQPNDPYFSKISEVVDPKNKAISKYPIYKGDWITKKKLAEKKGLKSLLETGKRAYSIPISQEAEIAGGFIEPADRVDVLLTIDSEEAGGAITSTLLQNIPVLAVGEVYTTSVSSDDTAKKGKDAKVRNVTLMVTPEQANELQLGASKGSLALTLRGTQDQTNATPTPATVYGLMGKQSPALATADAGGPAVPNGDIVRLEEQIRKLQEAMASGGAAEGTLPPVTGAIVTEKPTFLTIQILRGTAQSEVRFKKPSKSASN